jgi:DnaK suppressor protein
MAQKNLTSTALIDETIRATDREFYQLLQDRIKELLPLEVTTRANLDQQVMEGPGDDGDLSVFDANADYFLTLAESHQRELGEIRAAIDRIHREVYGICENCELSISRERLQKIPAARLCIICQSEREKRSLTALPGGKRSTL